MKPKGSKHFSISKIGKTFLQTMYNDSKATKIVSRYAILSGTNKGELFECKVPSEYEFTLSIFDDDNCDGENVVTYFATISPGVCTQTRSTGTWFKYTLIGNASSIYYYSSPYCSEESILSFNDYLLDTCTTGNVNVHHSKYRYVLSKKSGFCTRDIDGIDLVYFEKNHCQSFQYLSFDYYMYIRIKYDKTIKFYNDSECKNEMEGMSFSFFGCSEPELSVSGFTINNKGYLLTHKVDEPSAKSIPTYFMNPKCSSYFGVLHYNIFVESGIIHTIIYNSEDSCTGEGTVNSIECGVGQSEFINSNSDVQWNSECAKNVNTPNVDMCRLLEEGGMIIMQTRRKYYFPCLDILASAYFLDDTFALLHYNKTTNERIGAFAFRNTNDPALNGANECNVKDFCLQYRLVIKMKRSVLAIIHHSIIS